MSGRIGNLSAKQADELAQLKDAMKDVLKAEHDDILLLRFLRARQFDLKATEDMLRKDLEWREKINIEAVKKEFVPPEVLKKYFGGGSVGFDKDGAVVWIDPTDRRDIKGILKSCKGSDFMKYWMQLLEKYVSVTEEQNRKLEKDVGGITAVYDVQGFGGDYLWKPWIDIMRKIAAVMEQHYPEILKKCFVINTPKLFMVFYAICKPLLREATRKKVIFLGSDWKSELLKYIDADNLPAYYGGSRVDPDGDPKCPSLVMPAGVVPEIFYIQGRDLSNRTLQTRDIAITGTLDFKYEVTKPGSILSYEFRTKQADIAFSVRKFNPDGSKTDIVSNERHNCYISPEEGQIDLEETGVYVVRFDNSYSFTRSKTLSYFMELLEPLDEEKEPEFQEEEGVEDLSTLD